MREVAKSTFEDGPQNRMLDGVLGCLERGRVMMAEGSTGLGKARIIGKAALECRRMRPKERVLVMTNSISNLAHLAREMDASREGGLGDELGLLVGSGQFVSEARLLDLAEELMQHAPLGADSLIQWVDGGAKPQHADTRFLCERFGIEGWLLEDAVSLLQGVMGKEEIRTRIGRTPTEEHDLLKERVAKAGIVLATQAVVAVTVFKEISGGGDNPPKNLTGSHKVFQTGVLEGVGAVLCDEAHELENSFSGGVSSNLSLHSIERASKLLPSSGAAKVKRLCDCLRDAIGPIPCKTVLSDSSKDRLRQLVEVASAEIGSALGLGGKSNSGRGESKRKELSEAVSRNLKTALDHLKLFSSTSQWERLDAVPSPTRSWIRIEKGPKGVLWLLKSMWDSSTRGAALSATLLVKGSRFSNSSSRVEPMRSRLGIPKDRLESGEYAADWLYRIPTVFVPSAKNASKLCYCSSLKANSGYINWINETSKMIKQVSKTAKGGTLVLCSAFKDIETLESRMGTRMDERLIAQSEGASVSSLAALFRMKAAEGKRPVWLATGSAWTGLDLTDKESSEDFLLTDLVVLRIPVGGGSNSVAAARRARREESRNMGLEFVDRKAEAHIKLRQGIGRLVRRPGVADRRIWFLDGRPYVQGEYQFFKPFAAVFEDYEKVCEF